ncbi:MAG: hypothetical protein KJ587_02830 [Alphaproteobacteria bacterium]|nr:hypothetical protein [Alphaproteobacteria bacterium]
MISLCDNCGHEIRWSWTEAFEKFGFNDGDGQVETWQVEGVLTDAGYAVTVQGWGLHNTVITSVKKDGVEQIPYGRPGFTFGYDEPRSYLPPEIIALLDEHFPDEIGGAP